MKLAAGTLTVAVVVGIAVLTLFVWLPGARGIAWADIADALRAVRTVHMTGEEKGVLKDKWIQREPFAVYEHVRPISPGTPEESSREYVFAGNAEKVCWYFPERGNRAVIGRGLESDFMNNVLAPLGWSESTEAESRPKMIGRATVDGRRALLLELTGWDERTELAVDADTKLALRLRQFALDEAGEQVEVTRLRFEYDQRPPEGVFDWVPPAGATVVDKR